MTRWARKKHVCKDNSANATSWSELREGLSHGENSSHSHLQGNPSHHRPDGKRLNKNRQLDDVNGFMDYLKKKRKSLPKEQQAMGIKKQAIREVVTTALKKDNRRENRRIKRQNVKKGNMVCFNCRKTGHGLADCPKAADEDMSRGICFRCGSTEHDIQRCRAKVDPAVGDYPYAKCFICEKTGHISKSCPDNPKGLYAAGGCCRICGSVEHFQKDCPEHQTATNSISLGRLSNKISADHEEVSVPVKQVSIKKAKVVMF